MKEIGKRKFASELVKTRNQTAAAKAAGYSAKTAKQQGSRLAKDPIVKELLCEALKKFDMQKAFEELDENRRIALTDCEIPQTATAQRVTEFKCKLANLVPEEKSKIEHIGALDIKNTFTFAQLCQSETVRKPKK